MDIVEKAVEFAKKEYLKNDPKHQWGHVEKVMEKALEIAKGAKGVDYELLKLSVIFHDVDYHTEPSFEENYRKHVENSIAVAECFLKRSGYPKERIEKVMQIMLDHSTPHREKFGDSKVVEGKILYDADKTGSINDDIRRKLSAEERKKYHDLLYFEQSKKMYKA